MIVGGRGRGFISPGRHTRAGTDTARAGTDTARADTARTGTDTARAGTDTARAGTDTARAGTDTAREMWLAIPQGLRVPTKSFGQLNVTKPLAALSA